MNEKEFSKRIDMAIEALKEIHPLYKKGYHNSVCYVLYEYINNKCLYVNDSIPVCIFAELFKPVDSQLNDYWLGEFNDEGLHIRMIALRLFERMCIDEKLYKSF